MILTSSDVGSLAGKLWWWEHAEYIFAALVTVACLGEYVADFSKRDWIVARKDDIAKRSTLLLIAALALELVCLVQTNSLSGQLIGSLDEKAAHADSLAQSAATRSDTALSKSSAAEGKADAASSKADIAEGKAEIATGAASKAETSARSAGQKALAVENQAKSLQRNIAAEEEELTRLNAQRKLTNAEDMAERLRKFHGTSYTFSGVFNNQESILFLLSIDAVLQKAKWNRVPPTPVGTLDLFGLPVFGKNGPLLAETSGSGVQIFIELPISFGAYKSDAELPPHAQAAVELNRLLFSGMYPPEPDAKDKKPVDKGVGG